MRHSRPTFQRWHESSAHTRCAPDRPQADNSNWPAAASLRPGPTPRARAPARARTGSKMASWDGRRRVEIDQADRSRRQLNLELCTLTSRISTDLEIRCWIELDAQGLHEVVEQGARVVILSAPDLIEVADEFQRRERGNAQVHAIRALICVGKHAKAVAIVRDG